MAKINRYGGNLQAFGVNSTGANRTIFGGLTQSDELDQNINTDFYTGWEIVLPDEVPSKQDFNALGFTTTQLAAYIYQMGVAEYHASQEYHTDSLCSYDGVLYISLTDSNTGNTPDSSPSNWTGHATLSDLSDYYTSAQLDAGQLDNRYYTETELDGGQLDTLYYTQTLLDGGQLDGRYYTETEVDSALALKSNTGHVHAGEDITTGSISIGTGEDITLANSANIQGTEVGSTVRDILTVDSSDITQVGSSNLPTNINSDGNLTHNSDIIYDSGSGPMAGFRNKIINGDFAISQRGTSWAGISGSIYLFDRWYTNTSGATVTYSREEFTRGQTDVPGEPRYYAQAECTVANDNWGFIQRVEDVRTFAGQPCVLSAYVWSSATVTGSMLIRQVFDSGDASVTLTYNPTFTNSWNRYEFAVDIGSISGTTPGADSYIELFFLVGTNTTGTLRIARPQFEYGTIATPFEERPVQTELALCQRYYEKTYNISVSPGTVDNNGSSCYRFPTGSTLIPGTQYKVQKRVAPTVTIYSTNSGSSGNVYNASTASDAPISTVSGIGDYAFRYLQLSSSASQYDNIYYHAEYDSEL